jgi:hypothetical protein
MTGMTELSGRWTAGIRNMANNGRSAKEIAEFYGVDPAAIGRFLRRPLSRDRWAKGTDRPIIGSIATRVRALVDHEWNDADIAAVLELDPQRVRDFLWRLEPVRRGRLTRPRTRAEQERLERNQSKLPKPKRLPDAWKLAALEDERYRDPVSTLEAPAPAAELVDQPAAELAPGPADPPRPPIAESWGSVHASGPRKITSEVLARAVAMRSQGMSWPAIARELGCHRMALYHALRRPPP